MTQSPLPVHRPPTHAHAAPRMPVLVGALYSCGPLISDSHRQASPMAAMTIATGIVAQDDIQVLHPVLGIYASGMSSDPIADLGRTLGQFAGDLAELFRANDQPRPGTPAGSEADGEPFAGGWWAQPARELMATIALASASCGDYLTVTCAVPKPCAGSDLLFYARRSCPFASSTCSWSGCSAGWCCWRAVTPPRTRRSWSSGRRSRCCGVRSPDRGRAGLTAPFSPRWPGCCPGICGRTGS